MPWTWERLLRNRPLDVWMHEQDVRRAVGLPGGLDSAPARHTADYLTESLDLVVGKRVGPAAGTTVVIEVTGSPAYAVTVGDDGRARPVEPPPDPTVRLRMDREDFIVLAGGRRRRPRRGSRATRSWAPHPRRVRGDPVTWDLGLDDIGDQSGRTFVVTGCTSGIGQHTVLELARHGARVVLAARSADKLAATAATIRREVPDADLERVVVDLSDLASVRHGAAESPELGPIDVLVNNAGVMATPRQRTVDGLDLQMATNHFGPFLFTGLLLPQLVARATPASSRCPPTGTGWRAPRRSATRGRRRGATRAGVSTGRPSWPTCSSPTSSTAAPARPACRSPRPPRTRATPRRTCCPTARP